MSWWNPDWRYRVEHVQDHTKVLADLVDFPMYWDLSELPADAWDHINAGGGDLRTVAADDLTQLAREVVSCDVAAETGEVHTKVTLSSAADTTTYLYFGNPDAVEPAEDSTYGKEAVWTGFAMVQHMNQDPSGSAPQMIDSTGNDNDGSSVGTMTSGDLVDAQLGKGIEFDGTDDKITVPYTASLDFERTVAFTVSFWCKPATLGASSDRMIMSTTPSGSTRGKFFSHTTYAGNELRVFLINTFPSNTLEVYALGLTVGSWNHCVVTYNGSSLASGVTITINGTARSVVTVKNTLSATILNSSGWHIAGRADVAIHFFKDAVDEVGIASAVVRSSAYIAASYANQNAPDAFGEFGPLESSFPKLITRSPARPATHSVDYKPTEAGFC